LGAFIPRVAVDQETSFAPITELKQLARLVSTSVNARLIPADDRAKLRNRVSELKDRISCDTPVEISRSGFNAADELRKLESLLGA
jgi:hypothetical protein